MQFDDEPLVVDVVPGVVRVHVAAHEIPWCPDGVGARVQGLPVVSYVSEGLTRIGQTEVLVTMRAGDPSTHDAVFAFYRAIHDASTRFGAVQAGQYTVFGDASPFARPRDGVAYLPPRAPAVPLPLPDDHLYALLMLPDEIAAVQRFGVYRVAGWLGSAYREYPWPRWSDVRRDTVVPAGALDDSYLSRMPRATASDVFLLQENERLLVQCLPRAHAALRETLDPATIPELFVLLTSPSPHAAGSLVWTHTAAAETTMIVPDGSRGRTFTGAFLGMVRHEGAAMGRQVEDGWIAFVPPDDFRNVCDALRNGTRLTIRLPEGSFRTLEVETVPDRVTLIDGSQATAAGGFHGAHPDVHVPAVAPGSRVEKRGLLLLNTPSQIEGRAEQFGAMMQAVGLGLHDAVERGVAAAAIDVTVHVDVAPDGSARIGLALRPPNEQPAAEALHRCIAGQLAQLVTPLPEGLRLEAYFVIDGGSGEPFGLVGSQRPSSTAHH